jgi:hypothetical protein
LSRAERRALGTRTGSRLLTCFQQALLVLVWLRTRQDIAVVGGVPTRAPGSAWRTKAVRDRSGDDDPGLLCD